MTALESTARSGQDADTGATDVLHFEGCACAACAREHEPSEALDGTLDAVTIAAEDTTTLADMADFLRSGYWNGVSREYNLGSTGRNPNNGVLEYNLSGFSNKLGISDVDGMTSARQDLVREAFKLYEEVLGISFVETSSANADFFFSDNYGGAFAASTGYRSGITYSVVNVQQSWSGGTSTFDDYTLQTILHEIGHALGLGHQGFYNGSGGYATDAVYAKDSWQASMMSYFSQSENTAITASFEFLQTPMAVDWIALGDIYGGDTGNGQTFGTQNAFTGDTVYGFNTNIPASVSAIWAAYSDYANRTASTIIDAGGIDTLDLSGYGADQLIDLTEVSREDTVQTASNVGGRIGNLTLAVGTVIENARGGSGSDSFLGNSADNSFWGNGGADSFIDSAGSDMYFGGAGSDTVSFLSAIANVAVAAVNGGLEIVADGAGMAVDFIDQTIEWLTFADTTISFDDAAALAGGGGPALPSVQIVNAVDNVGPITGTLATAGLTDDATPTLTGTLDGALGAGQSVGVYVDGALAGTAAVNGTGWSFTGPALGDGVHSFTARVLDGADEGAVSNSFSLSVDTQAPAISVTAIETTDTTPALTGTVDDGSASITVTVGGQSLAAQNLGNGTWTLGDNALAPLGAGTYDVTVTASDLAGNSVTDIAAGALTVTAQPTVPEAALAIGAVTVAQAGPDQWHSITFASAIADAVVMMGPVSDNDTDPAHARVRNVTDTGFEFQIEEFEYQDGVHGTETIGWMAVSAGTHDVGGLTVQAGSTTAVNESWSQVGLEPGLGNSPIVFAQVASDNDPTAAVTRLRDVSNAGFRVQMQNEEAAPNARGAEQIDWIALETGDGAFFDAARSPNIMTHITKTVQIDPLADIFIGGMITRDGGDTANLRLAEMSGNTAGIYVGEEQSAEAEINHTTEMVGYLTATEGFWFL